MKLASHSRRGFLEQVARGIAGASVGVPLLKSAVAAGGEIPFRTLGRSGKKVSLIGLGGFHIGVPKDEQEGIRLIHVAIDNGINFLDNCWDYHDGVSEVRMGKALRDGYRRKVFLMSKIDGQTKVSAAKQID